MKYYGFIEAMHGAWLPPKLLKVMKLTAMLLLMVLLQVSAKSYSQKITLNVTNTPLEKVLLLIEKQSGYVFFYDANDGMKNVDVHVSNMPLEFALKVCLQHTNLTYTIANKTIFLKRQANQLPISVRDTVKIRSIGGRILNDANKPLQGASIKTSDGKQVAVTDDNGVFIIDVSSPNTILRISYVGYDVREIKAGQLANPATIILTASITSLAEVAVNKGYYKESKLTSVGNVTTITAKEIGNQPVANVLQALQGRVPGMIVTQTSGVPGAAVNIQIRGQNSLDGFGSFDPLYVIDGVIYPPKVSIRGNGIGDITSGGSPLNYISPSDIESISILKDADATAIYGSRGGNGVILITTKKGSLGKMQVQATVQSGFSYLATSLKLMNTEQYLQMRKEGFKNDGLKSEAGIDLDLDGTWSQNSYTNWQKNIANGKGTGAAFNNAHLSLSGGDAYTQYLISSNYIRSNSLYRSDRNDRNGGALFNLSTSSADKRFNMQLSANYTSGINTEPAFDPYGSILNAPNAPPFFLPDGSPNWQGYNPNPTIPGVDDIYNIYKSKTQNIVASTNISYQIIKALQFRVMAGYNDLRQKELSTFSTTSINPIYVTPDFTSSAIFSDISNSSYNVSPQLNYSLTKGKHNINTIIGGEYQRRTSAEQVINGYGYILNSTLNSLAGASSIEKAAVDGEDYKIASSYTRINYNYDQKYLLNITGRRDGSSRFGPGRQYGNFGSIGAGWVFSNEDFIKEHFSVLSFGKIRVSYGVLGNEPGDSYRYLETYRYILNSPYGGGISLTPSNPPGVDFSWEKIKKQELGLELGFFNNRIQSSLSYYKSETSNQLLAFTLPDVTGFNQVITNLPATVQNTSLEFTLNTVNIKTANFQWRTNFNITIPHNKLVRYDGLATSPYAQRFTVGQPISSFKTYHYLGVDPSTGVYKFSDGKGGETFRPDTNRAVTNFKTINTTPQYFGGINNTFSYKGLQLDVFLQFSKQKAPNYLLGQNDAPGSFSAGGYAGNQPVVFLERWQKPGDAATYQKYTTLQSSDAGRAALLARQSDFGYVDAAYIRVKTMSLSWNIPPYWLTKAHIKSLTVFTRAQNLFTITNYKGPDPETASLTSLPPLKTIVFGIDLTL